MNLTPDDLAYHQRVTAALRAAQIVFQSWAEHLTEKYALRPQDSISESGEVIRQEPDLGPARD